MRLLTFCVVLLAAAAIAANAEKFGDLCNSHACKLKAVGLSNVPLAVYGVEQKVMTLLVPAEMSHNFKNGSWNMDSVLEFSAEPNANEVDNKIDSYSTIKNVTYDICFGGEFCWMRIRFNSTYQPTYFRLGGEYTLVDGVLWLHAECGFGYPAHTDTVTYVMEFETCVVNPLSGLNDCLVNVPADDKSAVGVFRRVEKPTWMKIV